LRSGSGNMSVPPDAVAGPEKPVFRTLFPCAGVFSDSANESQSEIRVSFHKVGKMFRRQGEYLPSARSCAFSAKN
jgi:hypothetical protein